MRIYSNLMSSVLRGDDAPQRNVGTKGPDHRVSTEGKRYEQYTPCELGELRSSGAAGEAAYQAMRADWIAAGKPRGNVTTSIFAAQRYEQLTPDQRAQLRSGSAAGEARYQALRERWEERGRPTGAAPSGGNAA